MQEYHILNFIIFLNFAIFFKTKSSCLVNGKTRNGRKFGNTWIIICNRKFYNLTKIGDLDIFRKFWILGMHVEGTTKSNITNKEKYTMPNLVSSELCESEITLYTFSEINSIFNVPKIWYTLTTYITDLLVPYLMFNQINDKMVF